MENFSRLVFDKNLQIEKLDFCYLYGLTRKYGNLFGTIIGNNDKRKHSATFSIDNGYFFVTLNTNKLFLSLKIENEDLSYVGLKKLENIFKFIWTEKGSKEDKETLNKIKKLKVDELIINNNGDLSFQELEPLTLEEEQQLKDLWGNNKPVIPSREIIILPDMTHNVIFTEQNENNYN